MIDTLLRQWTLLRLLPRHPRRLEPARLKDKLDAMGIAVTLRTVQRDLNALAAVFPLVASTGQSPLRFKSPVATAAAYPPGTTRPVPSGPR